MTSRKREVSETMHRRAPLTTGRCKRLSILCLLLAATVTASSAQDERPFDHSASFANLVSLNGTDGAYPTAALVQGTNGNLYGTAYSGGAYANGTVFTVSPRGELTRLYNFCAQASCADGANPNAPLVLGTDGNFYGTTLYGGAYGYGTVFKITPGGKRTTLYSFCAQASCADGANPTAALIQASDGNFYGITESGGAYIYDGTIFRLTFSGTLTTLYSFGYIDGDMVFGGGLIQGTNGNLFGTTGFGGANGAGTVFEITLTGILDTLYNFCETSGCLDGERPYGGLIQGVDGNFYGTTAFGGDTGGGTAFKITDGGALTTLYSFCALSSCADGQYPFAGLIQATDGNLYGTTLAGGANTTCEPFGRCGTAFKLTTTGTLTTLHEFCSQSACTDGDYLVAALVQATNGKLYGAAQFGGRNDSCPYGCGTLFSLAVGLGPFVETVPTSGTVGSPVKILGNNLTRATRVTFNGTAAVGFKVVSSSEITAIVPTSATSGSVQVTTPHGILTSNVPFQVQP
jgi:uncharacterized repeat protein (TIGR03803 family)